MALLFLLILNRHRLSLSRAGLYRLGAAIWFLGVLFLVPVGEYYLAFLHCIIGVLLLSIAGAATARAAALPRSAPLQLHIAGPAGPLLIDLHQ